MTNPQRKKIQSRPGLIGRKWPDSIISFMATNITFFR